MSSQIPRGIEGATSLLRHRGHLSSPGLMSIIELTFNGISLTDVDVAVEHTLSRTVDQALYYYPFPSSRAATILYY